MVLLSGSTLRFIIRLKCISALSSASKLRESYHRVVPFGFMNGIYMISPHWVSRENIFLQFDFCLDVECSVLCLAFSVSSAIDYFRYTTDIFITIGDITTYILVH